MLVINTPIETDAWVNYGHDLLRYQTARNYWVHFDIARAVEALRQGDDIGAHKLDRLLAKCWDAECPTCGEIVCPMHDPLHFHHEGCPGEAEHAGC